VPPTTAFFHYSQDEEALVAWGWVPRSQRMQVDIAFWSTETSRTELKKGQVGSRGHVFWLTTGLCPVGGSAWLHCPPAFSTRPSVSSTLTPETAPLPSCHEKPLDHGQPLLRVATVCKLQSTQKAPGPQPTCSLLTHSERMSNMQGTGGLGRFHRNTCRDLRAAGLLVLPFQTDFLTLQIVSI
jgi:hypothetical protein